MSKQEHGVGDYGEGFSNKVGALLSPSRSLCFVDLNCIPRNVPVYIICASSSMTAPVVLSTQPPKYSEEIGPWPAHRQGTCAILNSRDFVDRKRSGNRIIKHPWRNEHSRGREQVSTSSIGIKEVDSTTIGITTLMVKNIPCKKSQEDVLCLINQRGFKGKFDFFHLPRDRRLRTNLGYAFINLISEEDATRFKIAMSGYRFSKTSAKRCVVVPADVQGYSKNVAAFKRSENMRNSCRPRFAHYDPTMFAC